MNKAHYITSQAKWEELENDWKCSNPPNKRLLIWAAIQLIISIVCSFILITQNQLYGVIFLCVLSVATVVMAFGFTGRSRQAPNKYPCIIIESRNDLVVITFDNILPMLAHYEGWNIPK